MKRNHIQEHVTAELIRIAGPDRVRMDEPMYRHTTMKVGGNTALYISPGSVAQISAVIKLLRQEEIPYFVLGNGSNVICRDEGFAGAVVCLSDYFKGYRVLTKARSEDGTKGSENGTKECAGQAEGRTVLVSVKAGTDNKRFSDACMRRGFSGFEFASGIPGSLGGATAMNAGAYDGEMKNIVQRVRLLDPEGRVISRSSEEMKFGYRHSLVTDGDYIVLETVLKLREDDPELIAARVADLTRRREEKQPLSYPSCGSTFKRPEGYFAGKLISDAGLKGYCLGGAQVSDKHAGFIINRDGASASDILGLIEHVKKTVLEKSGVKLECEVKILG